MSNANPMTAMTQISHWVDVRRSFGSLVGMGLLRVSG